MTIEDLLKTASIDTPAVEAARTRQLHIAALGLAKTAGVSVPEFDMSAALNVLGRKVYTKRAEWRMIREGLAALRESVNE